MLTVVARALDVHLCCVALARDCRELVTSTGTLSEALCLAVAQELDRA